MTKTQLQRCLKGNQYHCLSLSWSGAGWISQALKEHTNERLVELDLGYNEIKDEGACAVAQVGMVDCT